MVRRTRSQALTPRSFPANMRTGSSKAASGTTYLRKLHELLLKRSSMSPRVDGLAWAVPDSSSVAFNGRGIQPSSFASVNILSG